MRLYGDEDMVYSVWRFCQIKCRAHREVVEWLPITDKNTA